MKTPSIRNYYSALQEQFELQSRVLTDVLPHAGERGRNDEERFREFLGRILPRKYSVGSGFVVCSETSVAVSRSVGPSKESIASIMNNQSYFAPAGSDGPKFPLPARWSIRLRSLDGEGIPVRMAIGFDETLEFLEVGTPFQFDFVASQYTALIAALNPDARIGAEVWSDLYGEFRRGGGFSSGSKGKLTFHPSGPTYSSAGTGF